MKSIITLSRQLKKQIGAHYKLIGKPNLSDGDYWAARAQSDQAVSTARYLIQYLNPQQAAIVSSFTGVRA
jgi:hypothetical protein